MKKLILISFLSILSIGAFAQAVLLKDTVYLKVPVGTLNVDLHDTIINPLSVKLPQVWAISNQTTLPAGFSVTSVCTQPYPTGLGQCVNYTFAPHDEDTLPANGGMDFKLSVKIAQNAIPNAISYVLINSDIINKPMVFAIESFIPASLKPVTSFNNVSLYPSPASNILNLVHNSALVSKAVVYNVIGKKLITYNTPVGEKGFSIPVTDLSNGIYFIEIQDKNGVKLALKKFVKN
jgi:hypothetical protein